MLGKGKLAQVELAKAGETMANRSGETPLKFVSIQVMNEIELMKRKIKNLESKLKEATKNGYEIGIDKAMDVCDKEEEKIKDVTELERHSSSAFAAGYRIGCQSCRKGIKSIKRESI